MVQIPRQHFFSALKRGPNRKRIEKQCNGIKPQVNYDHKQFFTKCYWQEELTYTHTHKNKNREVFFMAQPAKGPKKEDKKKRKRERKKKTNKQTEFHIKD